MKGRPKLLCLLVILVGLFKKWLKQLKMIVCSSFSILYFLFFVKFMPQYVVLKKLPILLILEFQLDILIA